MSSGLFGDEAAPVRADSAFSMLHGLYWLLNNLAAEEPLALVVDDLHWADAESLRFLVYLAPRLDGLPVTVLATTRPGEGDQAQLGRLGAAPETTMVRPRAAQQRGHGDPVRARARLRRGARVRRGLPRGHRRQPLLPRGAAARGASSSTSRSTRAARGGCASSARRRWRRPCCCRCRTSPRAPRRWCARPRCWATARASPRRRRSRALRGGGRRRRRPARGARDPDARPSRRVRPPDRARGRLCRHRPAPARPRTRRRRRACCTRAARRRSASRPRSRRRRRRATSVRVELLRRVAAGALSAAPRRPPTTLLARALAEPPATETRPEVLVELGWRGAAPGRAGCDRPPERGGRHDQRSRAARDRRAPARQRADGDRAGRPCGRGARDARSTWWSPRTASSGSCSKPSSPPMPGRRASRRGRRPPGASSGATDLTGATPGERLVLASLACERARTSDSAAESVSLLEERARRGTAAGGAAARHRRPLLRPRARPDRRRCVRSRRGEPRAGPRQRPRARVDPIDRVPHQSPRLDVPASRLGRPRRIRRAHRPRAAQLALDPARHSVRGRAPDRSPDRGAATPTPPSRRCTATTCPTRSSRARPPTSCCARARCCTGAAGAPSRQSRTCSSSAAATSCGAAPTRSPRAGAHTPRWRSSRSGTPRARAGWRPRTSSARGAGGCGRDRRRAPRGRARRGRRHRRRAAARGGERARAAHPRGSSTRARSPTSAPHCGARTAAPRRAGSCSRRSSWPTPAARARIAERARTELRAAGGRSSDPEADGVAQLTASERRVAELAAQGHSNPEIAQSLFVTRKTVETHLGHVYRKLGIAGRGELGPRALRRLRIAPPSPKFREPVRGAPRRPRRGPALTVAVMARNGDELFNPATGLRTVFRQTAEETNGELLQVDWIADGPWTTGPDHIHPLQDERFEVVSGRLGLRVNGVEHVLEPGDALEAPAGAPARRLERRRRRRPCARRLPAGAADRDGLRDARRARAGRQDHLGRRAQEPPAAGPRPAPLRGRDLPGAAAARRSARADGAARGARPPARLPARVPVPPTHKESQ